MIAPSEKALSRNVHVAPRGATWSHVAAPKHDSAFSEGAINVSRYPIVSTWIHVASTWTRWPWLLGCAIAPFEKGAIGAPSSSSSQRQTDARESLRGDGELGKGKARRVYSFTAEEDVARRKVDGAEQPESGRDAGSRERARGESEREEERLLLLLVVSEARSEEARKRSGGAPIGHRRRRRRSSEGGGGRLVRLVKIAPFEKALSVHVSATSAHLIPQVITKFYAIRKSPHEVIDDDLDSQCECLLQDDPELWSFDNHADLSTADYIFALEQELQTLRSHVDNLQSKFQMGLEIELHLKKNVRKLEKREVLKKLDMIRKNDIERILTEREKKETAVRELRRGSRGRPARKEKAELQPQMATPMADAAAALTDSRWRMADQQRGGGYAEAAADDGIGRQQRGPSSGSRDRHGNSGDIGVSAADELQRRRRRRVAAAPRRQ
ncbi:hypothetical protein Syun_023890 [Stephania yunnanensis]|uniref:Uncharacterized protein n=1 Tax=Stephania yunnanensis TaxID=152371 RepID=A0AAP0I3W9_9MAGN